MNNLEKLAEKVQSTNADLRVSLKHKTRVCQLETREQYVEHAQPNVVGCVRFAVGHVETLDTHPASCLTLMGECKETVQARCCH